MTYFCQSQRNFFLEELFAVIFQHCYKTDLQARKHLKAVSIIPFSFKCMINIPSLLQ